MRGSQSWSVGPLWHYKRFLLGQFIQLKYDKASCRQIMFILLFLFNLNLRVSLFTLQRIILQIKKIINSTEHKQASTIRFKLILILINYVAHFQSEFLPQINCHKSKRSQTNLHSNFFSDQVAAELQLRKTCLCLK